MKIKKERFYSIWFKMSVIFSGLLILCGISLFVFSIYRFNSVYRQQAQSHLEDVESLATENLEEMIEQIDQLSVSVLVDQIVQTNLSYIDTHEDKSIYKKNDAIISQVRAGVFNIDGVVSLRIYSLTGEELFVGTTNREYLDYSLTPEEIYEANGAALWKMNEEGNYICMGRTILNTTTMMPLGYMVIVCKNSYFSSRLSTIPSVYGSEIYMIDEEGHIVASSDTKVIGECFPEEDGEYVIDPSSGEKSYYFNSDTLSNGWSLTTTVTKERLTKEIVMNFFVAGAFFLLILILIFAFVKIAIKRLAKPTRRLVRSMNAFGEGDLSARVEIQTHDEIGEIGSVYNEMADNIEKLMKEVYTLELANKEAEIEYLKMQITPHFLYNTLDTISWLGFTNGCEEISNLAVALAGLLRSSIKNDDIITVRQELKTVKDYLYIQSYRFGDRFTAEYDIDPEACGCYMPNFILQPLIENSIIHGLESQLKKGVLKISIHRKNKWLMFVISDNGKGMEEEQVKKLMEECEDMKSRNSIGLKNVYRRLMLIYHESSEFKLTSEPEAGTCISFRIPVDEDGEQKEKEELNEAGTE